MAFAALLGEWYTPGGNRIRDFRWPSTFTRGWRFYFLRHIAANKTSIKPGSFSRSRNRTLFRSILIAPLRTLALIALCATRHRERRVFTRLMSQITA